MRLTHWIANLSGKRPAPRLRRRNRQHAPAVPQMVEKLENRQLLSAVTALPAAQPAGQNPEFVPGQLLIQFDQGAGDTARDQVRQQLGATLVERIETEAMKAAGAGVLELVNLPPRLAVAQAAGGLKGHPLVRFAEPNWVLTHQATVSNDFYYEDGQLWGMYGANEDGTANPAGDSAKTTTPYGSQAEEAWYDGNVGSRAVYVGIIDEGIDYRHPDLYLNVGINQTEIPSTVRANLSDVDGDGLITFYDLNHEDSNGNAINQGSGRITDLNKTGYIDGGDLLYSVSSGGWADGQDGTAYELKDASGQLLVSVRDDGNTLTDDLVGWDFAGGNNSTYDGTSDDHGTHVAGTIGAIGGNGIGVAGVNWQVSMIPVKFLGAFGGTTANAVKAVDYITDLKLTQGLNIVATNNSWGGGGYSEALHSAIIRAAKADILFIAAAGNGGSDGVGDDNDLTPNYPSNYDTAVGTSTESAASYDGVIAVAATGSGGGLESFSNYGKTTVDLGAPGSGIWSTVPDGKYNPHSGTSMATPHVTGAAALYAAANPGATAQEIRDAIFGSVIKSDSLAGKMVTGGRLNVGGFAVPAVPSITVNDASVVEGRSGASASLQFTVTLSREATESVSVRYFTADGTSNPATAAIDYVATGNTLTFQPGETVKTVTVEIIGDDVEELNETFFLNLAEATGATIARDQGVGTIVDDDGPVITIGDFAMDEGNSGTTNAEFVVTLSKASAFDLSVQYATVDGAASAGGDYTATSGILIIGAGKTSGTIVVPVTGDTLYEPDETFFVDLSSPSHGTLGDAQAEGTIRNDDSQPVGSETDMYVRDMLWSERLYGRWRDLTVTVDVHRDSNESGQADSGDLAVEGATVELLLVHDANKNLKIDAGEQEWRGTAQTAADGTVSLTLSKAPSGFYIASATPVRHETYTWKSSLESENPDYYDTSTRKEIDASASVSGFLAAQDFTAGGEPVTALHRGARSEALSVEPGILSALIEQPGGESLVAPGSQSGGRSAGSVDVRPAGSPAASSRTSALDSIFADGLLVDALLSA